MEKYIVTLFEVLIEVLEVPKGADMDKIKENVSSRVRREYEADGIDKNLGEEVFEELMKEIKISKVVSTTTLREEGQVATDGEYIDVDVHIKVFVCVTENGEDFKLPQYKIIPINSDDIGKFSKIEADKTNFYGDILIFADNE